MASSTSWSQDLLDIVIIVLIYLDHILLLVELVGLTHLYSRSLLLILELWLFRVMLILPILLISSPRTILLLPFLLTTFRFLEPFWLLKVLADTLTIVEVLIILILLIWFVGMDLLLKHILSVVSLSHYLIIPIIHRLVMLSSLLLWISIISIWLLLVLLDLS